MAQEYEAPRNRQTHDVDRSPEAIHAEMDRTREALANKIEALEDEVTSKVHAVKEKVREGAEKVKHAFDLPYQVRQHPWPMFGASVVVGLVIGSLTGDSEIRDADKPGRRLEFGGGNRLVGREDDDDLRPPAKPGIFAEELRMLRQAAVGAMMSLVRNGLRETFPGLAPQTDRAVDGITRKLGGEPVESVFEAPAG